MTGAIFIPRGDRLRVAAFAAAFLAVTSLTVFLTRFGGGIALVWPGTGILAALLVQLPRANWPVVAILFTALNTVATSLFGIGPQVALPLSAVNIFEAVLIAALLLALRPQCDWLHQIRGLAILITVGGLIGPALASIMGGMVVASFKGGSWLGYAAHWVPAHGLGTILAFPMAFLVAAGMADNRRIRLDRRQLAIGAAHAAAIAAVCAVALFQTTYPLIFLPIVALLLAAFQLGRVGASMGTIIIAGACAISMVVDGGFLEALLLPLAEKVLFLQFYIAVLLLLALPVAVALKQHQLLMAELEERKALEQLISDHSDDALLNLDAAGRVRYASPAGERLGGVEQLVGQPLTAFFDPLDELLVRNALANAAASPGETRVIERAVVRGDEQLWLEARLRAVAPEGRPAGMIGYVVTIREITARKHAELDAIQAAETDALTGLPNRRALLRQLDRGLAHAAKRPFAVAILDLDHFKAVNDTHGHNAGDTVLREVAAVMRRLSSPSRFFARLGGEEFALVALQSRFEDSRAVCEELRDAIAALEFTAPDGQRFAVNASIGLARITRTVSASNALQAADSLLYQAKESGRNRVVAAAAPTAPVRRANRVAA